MLVLAQIIIVTDGRDFFVDLKDVLKSIQTWDESLRLEITTSRIPLAPWLEKNRLHVDTAAPSLSFCFVLPPQAFTLEPGEYVHINEGRLHALRKVQPLLIWTCSAGSIIKLKKSRPCLLFTEEQAWVKCMKHR